VLRLGLPTDDLEEFTNGIIMRISTAGDVEDLVPAVFVVVY